MEQRKQGTVIVPQEPNFPRVSYHGWISTISTEMNVASALNSTGQISRECIGLRVLVGGNCMKIVLKIVSLTRMEKNISAPFVLIFFANRCFISFTVYLH